MSAPDFVNQPNNSPVIHPAVKQPEEPRPAPRNWQQSHNVIDITKQVNGLVDSAASAIKKKWHTLSRPERELLVIATLIFLIALVAFLILSAPYTLAAIAMTLPVIVPLIGVGALALYGFRYHRKKRLAIEKLNAMRTKEPEKFQEALKKDARRAELERQRIAEINAQRRAAIAAQKATRPKKTKRKPSASVNLNELE